MPNTLRVSLLAATATVSVVAVLLAAGRGSVSADGETPSPMPDARSTITIRFVRDGEQITIWTTMPFSKIEADGVLCNIGTTTMPVAVDHFTIPWPLGSGGLAKECLKGPPTMVRIEFLPYDPLADRLFDAIGGEAEWTGEDTVVDLEVPLEVPGTSTSPTPGDLPSAGARAGGQSAVSPSGIAALMVIIGAAAVVSAKLMRGIPRE